MERSKVTDYMIQCLKEHGISAAQAARVVSIPQRKIEEGYEKPLTAEEFLELCVYLGVSPEDVRDAINNDEYVRKISRKNA